MQLRWSRRPPGGARRETTTPEYDYLFVVTYGRSGSTLLQGILTSTPGFRIRGENGAAVHHLYQSFRACEEQRRTYQVRRRLDTTEPWYGIDEFPSELSRELIRKLVLETIIRPEPGDRVVGFKEIRWYQDDLEDFVSFLQDTFPGARFLFNSRCLDDVCRSGWWKEHPDAREHLERIEQRHASLRTGLGEAAFHVRYDEYVADPSTLRALFTWLGEDFDAGRVERVLARHHSY